MPCEPTSHPTGSRTFSAFTSGRQARRPDSAVAPGASSSARSTLWPRLSLFRPGVPDPLERLLAAEQFDALEEAGCDLRAGDRDANRLERLARFQLEPLGEAAEVGLDRLGRERIGFRENSRRLHEDLTVEKGSVWL